MAPLLCPCCAIPPDLFLPPPPPTTDNDVRNDSNTTEEIAVAKEDPDANDDESLHIPSPAQALAALAGQPLIDTHNHTHLASDNDDDDDDSYYPICSSHADQQILFRSIPCALHPSDWDACLRAGGCLQRNYNNDDDGTNNNDSGEDKRNATKDPQQLHQSLPRTARAALGVHPWYVIHNSKALPPDWLERLAAHLQQHPGVWVGEIGLCKVAQWVRNSPDKTAALDRQRQVFVQQLELAVQYQRPVSIHCVHQHGVLLELFQKTLVANNKIDNNDSNSKTSPWHPPAIALHSFSGTAHHIQQLLAWERATIPKAAQPLFYFGFSHVVNYRMMYGDSDANSSSKSSQRNRRHTVAAIRAVPSDRLVVESDVRGRGGRAATAAAVAFVAAVRGESLTRIARLSTENAQQLLRSVHPTEA